MDQGKDRPGLAREVPHEAYFKTAPANNALHGVGEASTS